ncbi:MAG: PIN domain-containing protein [Candidatus Thiodiazotropha sp. (ex Epidulcina cf. delphinae)]|nr:PIN domain-containing protein [Candidatus Thiodiazotropha sp. (ex Epidulcina cf. delphinae)]
MRYTVVFDACVLYPAPLRDFLHRLSMTGLFAAKWTDQIHDEWIRNVLKAHPELEDKLPRTRDLMNRAVSDALVTGYETLIEKLELPDADDRHVLAAAIRCGAQAIVTFNLKDFPDDVLAQYGIEGIHPDHFIEHQLDLHQGAVMATAKQHRAALKNPSKTSAEYLESLAAQGLVISADRLRDFIELI